MVTSKEQTPGVHVAVSTASFLEMGMKRGVGIGIGALARQPDLRELEFTYQVAELLGIGVEVAYRVLGSQAIKDISQESRVPTVSVHMPIFANRRRFIEHKFPLGLGTLVNYAGSEFGLGFGESSWKGIQELAVALPDAVFVAHPDLAVWLHERLAQDEPFRGRVGVEADWPSVPNSPRLICDTQEVVRIIKKGNYAANPDTSHNSLTLNPPVEGIAESLNAMVDAYGFPTLRRIHFSANTPYPQGRAPLGWAGGSLPLNSDLLGPEHVRQYHEWYTETDRKAKAAGVAVHMPIEIYGWTKRGDTPGTYSAIPYAQRARGIEATMNGLLHGKIERGSRSYPNRPTVTLQS